MVVAGHSISHLIARRDDSAEVGTATREAITALAAVLDPGEEIVVILDSGEPRARDERDDRLELFVLASAESGERADELRKALRTLLAGSRAGVELSELDSETAQSAWTALAGGKCTSFVPVFAELSDRVPGFSSPPAEPLSLPTFPKHDEAGLLALCEALLRADGPTLLRVRLATARLEARERLELASRHGGGSLIPSELAAVIAEIGEPVTVSMELRSAREDPGLAAAISRAFPGTVPQRGRQEEHVLGSAPAAALVPIPVALRDAVPGFPVRVARAIAAPWPVAPDARGLELGEAISADGQLIKPRLTDNDLRRHMHVVGGTGVGKSTLLAHLARADAAAGNGLCVLDPHGSLIEDLLSSLPSERAEDVIVIDAADVGYPVPLNPLAVDGELARASVVQDLSEMFYDLFGHEIIGPKFESWLRMAVLTLMETDGERASFLDVTRMYTDHDFLATRLPHVKDPELQLFWQGEIRQTQAFHKSEMLGYFNSKFERFRSNPTLRNLLGTGRSSVDYTEFIGDRRIVLISLAKGDIGQVNARLLGYLHLSRLWADILRRGAAETPFSVYVDEAQAFSMGSLPAMIAEGRKFGLRLFLAHQFTEQLRPEMRSAVSGTVGSSVVFRCGKADAEAEALRTEPTFSAADLRRLPSFEAACTVLASGEPQPPFTLMVSPPPGKRSKAAAQRHRRRSRDRYAIKRKAIEKELAERWAAVDEPEPEPLQSPEPPDPDELDRALRQMAARAAEDDE